LPEPRLVFAIPGDLNSPTGGYAYARRMIAALGAAGWQVQHLPLGEGFPHPDAATRAHATALLASADTGIALLVDGLALGALPEVGSALQPGHRLVALVHHPLALESGLDAATAQALEASERAALSAACRVVTTSHSTARALVADFGVPQERISVVVPGTDPVAATTRVARSHGAGRVEVLSVGSLVPRKGHDLLLSALASLAALPWRLTLVGDDSRDDRWAYALQQRAQRAGIADRVLFTGAIDATRLSALYAAADLFVLPSRHEGFGMVFTEAIAHGLPLLGTTAGAIPEAVPAGAGRLVPPDDLPALTAALRELLTDPVARTQLAEGARAVARSLPTWEASAARLAEVLAQVAR